MSLRKCELEVPTWQPVALTIIGPTACMRFQGACTHPCYKALRRSGMAMEEG